MLCRRVLAGLLVLGLIGCAEGSPFEGGSGGAGGGLLGGGGSGIGGSGNMPPATTGVGGQPIGGMGGQTVGGMGGAGGLGGMGGMVEMCDFSATNLCTSADALGSIPGDESGPTKMATGQGGRWVKLRVTEESGSIFDEDLSYTVTLVSPPGMQYDVRVFEGSDGGGENCNPPALTSTTVGNSKQVYHKWDDSQPIGGEDDSRWINVEVFHVSGEECDVGDDWTLTIEGNT